MSLRRSGRSLVADQEISLYDIIQYLHSLSEQFSEFSTADLQKPKEERITKLYCILYEYLTSRKLGFMSDQLLERWHSKRDATPLPSPPASMLQHVKACHDINVLLVKMQNSDCPGDVAAIGGARRREYVQMNLGDFRMPTVKRTKEIFKFLVLFGLTVKESRSRAEETKNEVFQLQGQLQGLQQRFQSLQKQRGLLLEQGQSEEEEVEELKATIHSHTKARAQLSAELTQQTDNVKEGKNEKDNLQRIHDEQVEKIEELRRELEGLASEIPDSPAIMATTDTELKQKTSKYEENSRVFVSLGKSLECKKEFVKCQKEILSTLKDMKQANSHSEELEKLVTEGGQQLKTDNQLLFKDQAATQDLECDVQVLEDKYTKLVADYDLKINEEMEAISRGESEKAELEKKKKKCQKSRTKMDEEKSKVLHEMEERREENNKLMQKSKAVISQIMKVYKESKNSLERTVHEFTVSMEQEHQHIMGPIQEEQEIIQDLLAALREVKKRSKQQQ